jgi:hypothetical protein
MVTKGSKSIKTITEKNRQQRSNTQKYTEA